MGRHILMICTSGTSAVTSLPSVEALLSNFESLSDEQIMNAVLNIEGSRDYNKRLKAISLYQVLR
ncbi:MAG: hypothetical protein IJG36_12680 [Synergistaceae bacterium]|nr:hypothetical protein [Synergistaceae bacterium]